MLQSLHPLFLGTRPNEAPTRGGLFGAHMDRCFGRLTSSQQDSTVSLARSLWDVKTRPAGAATVVQPVPPGSKV